MICGSHTGSSRIGQTYWLTHLLVTSVIGNFFGSCPLFFLYTHGDKIGWISLWGTVNTIHNPGGFLAVLPGLHPGLC